MGQCFSAPILLSSPSAKVFPWKEQRTPLCTRPSELKEPQPYNLKPYAAVQ